MDDISLILVAGPKWNFFVVAGADPDHDSEDADLRFFSWLVIKLECVLGHLYFSQSILEV